MLAGMLSTGVLNATFELEKSFNNLLLFCEILCLPQNLLDVLYALQCREKLAIEHRLLRQELDIILFLLQALLFLIV
jgi:hypothetical protein